MSGKNELDLILSAIPALVWSARPDGYIDFFNQRWFDYTGMTSEQAKGWGWAKAVHPLDHNGLVERWRSCLASGTPFDMEARMCRLDGAYRWFWFRANPLRDQSRKIVKWYGTNIDIEDRKRGEESLRTKEMSWRQIVDNIPGFVHTTSATGEVEFLNRQVLEYFGKPTEDLKHWAITDIVHPDDLPRVIAAWRKSIETGQTYEIEQRCRRADGVYRWFQARGRAVRNPEGEITAWYWLLTDIEDRKRAEVAVRASERNLKLIIDTIPAVAWSARTDGSADFFSQHYLDYVGLSAEQLKDWGWTAVVHLDDLNGLRAGLQRVMASGHAGEAEARFRRFDGAYRWFLFRISPLRDESGKIVKWYGTNIDIEDRKRGEEALRARELSWRQIVDNIPGFVVMMTARGDVEFLNRQTLEYFGKSNEELKNWALTDAVHPDDLPRVFEARAKSIEAGQIYDVEHRCRRADGVYRWFQVRGLPVRNAEGAITAWYLLLTDIDDRKRAEVELERAYLLLAEAQRLSKTGGFITDLLVDEHNWSEEARRIFEFDPATKVTAQAFREKIHPEDLPSVDAVLARGMEGIDADIVFRILTSGGTVKHIHGIAHVTRYVEGRPVFSGALQDVTETKLAEEALSRARSELAHVARVSTLNALTASIAHEINQPLAGIITNAGTCLRMLSGDPPNVDGARETARRTIRDGNRAADVISRLRALYSKKEFALEPLDLNEATREVVALSLSDLQRNRIILRLEFADDLPPVTGDRVQLQQVILNLLRNASEAMVDVDDRPRHLLIRTRHEGYDRVCLSVQDAGVGIDPKDLERLFDAFYTTKVGGMGIGLSVSRSIVERHQGRLWAEANAGPGSTFSFSIPRCPAPSTAHGEPA